jgi:hypothetical protein
MYTGRCGDPRLAFSVVGAIGIGLVAGVYTASVADQHDVAPRQQQVDLQSGSWNARMGMPEGDPRRAIMRADGTAA